MVTGSQFHWNERKDFEKSVNSSCLRKGQAYRTLSLQLFFSEGNLICSSDVPADGKFHEADDCKRLSHYPDRFNLRRM